MSKPQDPDASDEESIADDLKILNQMNIDHDFNVWGEFRNSFSVKGRDSISSMISRSSKVSRTSITPVIEGVQSKWDPHEVSITECEFEGSNTDREVQGASKQSSPKAESDHDASLDVSFSRLTQGEQRDIRAWNIRMARDTVFSRYYFPEQWELRELKTIEKFLELEDPRECPWVLNEPGREVTKKAVTDIFYPGDHDPKSVLLKRGPVLFDGVEERELLLFTHGFLLSRMEFDTLLNILFTINSENPEYLSSSKLRERFDVIDSDNSGSLDRCELKEVFNGMGVPISENALSDIMERFDSDQDGTIDFEEFDTVMQSLKPKPKTEDRWSWGYLGEKLGQKLKQSMTQKAEMLECAFPLMDIEKIESIHICSSEPTQLFAKSSWASLMFAIYIKGGQEGTLIMVCSKPEHREAWVDAFRTCYVKSIQLKADSGFSAAKKIRSKVGWQHRIIRASLYSLVVCNDVTRLEELAANPPPDMCVNDQDEYCGYTALHYAAALGHLECAKILLKYQARVNLCDDDDKTPLDHAVLSEDKAMIDLLEQHGAKAHTSDVLFKSAVEEQKMLKEQTPKSKGKKTMAKAKEAAGAMSQAMSALKERGDKIERLDNKTAQLQSDAQNYAEMAKQMKERNKKKAGMFGL